VTAVRGSNQHDASSRTGRRSSATRHAVALALNENVTLCSTHCVPLPGGGADAMRLVRILVATPAEASR
jgi:hypothetical protein